MSDYTENYNLKKPYPDDFFDVNDFNGNADIIDKALASKLDVNSTDNLAKETSVQEIITKVNTNAKETSLQNLIAKVGNTTDINGSTNSGTAMAKLNLIQNNLTEVRNNLLPNRRKIIAKNFELQLTPNITTNILQVTGSGVLQGFWYRINSFNATTKIYLKIDNENIWTFSKTCGNVTGGNRASNVHGILSTPESWKMFYDFLQDSIQLPENANYYELNIGGSGSAQEIGSDSDTWLCLLDTGLIFKNDLTISMDTTYYGRTNTQNISVIYSLDC